MIIRFDHENKRTQVSLRAGEILKIVDKREQDVEDQTAAWHPEFAEYMIESTPGSPFGCNMHDHDLISNFNKVENNMRMRRADIEELLEPNECLLTLSSFPRLGCPNFTYPMQKADANGLSGSIFFPDRAIGIHPRSK